MASANDEILDIMTTRALDLQRLAAGQSRDVVRFLNDLEGDIVAQLARIDPTGIGSISRRASRLSKLLEQVRATITGSFRTEGVRLANELREIADMEAKFAAAAINQGAGVQLITTELTRGQLTAITGNLLVQGSPVSELLSRQAGDVLQRFTDNMRLGIAQGETNGELIRRIRGGKQNGAVVEGFMKISRAHAETLVRSATQAVSQASRQAVYNDNADIIKAEQWVSTIDLRTTVLCSVRDGLTYTVGDHEPIGHSLPWGGGPGNLHYGCRSTSTPVLKTFRELGLDIDEVPASTRASLDGQIPQDTSFESWLSRRTVAEQDANLGVGRAKLWRDGDISFRDLMDANGRELSLEELRTITNTAQNKAAGGIKPQVLSAYNSAPASVINAINLAPRLKSLTQTRGESGAFYASKSSKIEMGDKGVRPEGSESYNRILRHEFGHHVDYAGSSSARSVKFIDDLELDGAELNKSRTRYLRGDADRSGPDLDLARKTVDGYRSDARSAARRGDYRGQAQRVIEENIPEISFKDLTSIYGDINFEEALDFQAAWKARDVSYLLDKNVSDGSLLVGLQDTFGASLKGRVGMKFNHSEKYYADRGSQGQTTEAFANWFDVVGSGSPAATALYKHLFPRTFKAIEELIK
jgi:hypothetical protein